MILAVDIGTSSMKGALIDSKGTPQGYHRFYFPPNAFLPGKGFPPDLWSQGLLDILDNLSLEQVQGLVISGNGPTMVGCDKRGKPLGKAVMWNQHTTPLETESYYLPKVNTLRAQFPTVYKQADLFLSCPEFLTMQLTGEAVMTLPNDSYQTITWTDEELARHSFPKQKFPPQVKMGHYWAPISRRGRLKTTLKKGLPVIPGGSDFAMALIGVNALREGRICDRAGSSEGLNYCTSQVLNDPRLRSLPHPREGLYNESLILSSTGSLFEWYRHLTGQEKYSYHRTLRGIQDKSSIHQKAPLFFPSPRGKYLWEFSNSMFVGLSPQEGKYDLGRAVLESIGFSLRKGIDIFESHGLPVEKIRVSGGQGMNSFWNQMKADITGKTILRPQIEDAELLGGVCVARYSLGEFSSIAEGADKLFKIKKAYTPHQETHEIYSQKYKEYQGKATIASLFYKHYEK